MRYPFALALLLTAHAAAHAARHAEVRIERGGVVLMKGHLALPDAQEKADSWLELVDLAWEPVGPAVARLANAKEWAEKGMFRIIMTWGGHKTLVFDVPADRLELTADPATPNRWRMRTEEVMRIGRNAGLDVDRTPVPQWLFAVTAVIIGAIVLGLMMVWQWRRSEKLAALDKP